MPGASPAEIDTSILVGIENAVRGLDGIKHVDAEALEGVGSVTITLLERSDPQQVLGDIKNAVDRIHDLSPGSGKAQRHHPRTSGKSPLHRGVRRPAADVAAAKRRRPSGTICAPAQG